MSVAHPVLILERPGEDGRLVWSPTQLRSPALVITLLGMAELAVDPRPLYLVIAVVGTFAWLWATSGPILSPSMPDHQPGNPDVGRSTARWELYLTRVEALRHIGVDANDRPQVELTVVVASLTEPGQAYCATARTVLDRSQVADFEPGSVMVVARPDPMRPELVTVPKPPLDLAAAVRAETRTNPGNGLIPPVARVAIPAPLRRRGLLAASSVLAGAALLAAGTMSVLLPVLTV